MNLRSNKGRKRRRVSRVPAGLDDDARTFPIGRVYGYSPDANEDFVITGHSDGNMLNQRGAILSSDRHHQRLRLERVSEPGLPVG